MKYSVMFNGNTAEGKKIADVKRKLAAVLKVTSAEVEKMFAGEPMLIAGDADLEACEKLIKVGKRCGAIFYIKKQEEPASLKQPAPEPLSPVPPPESARKSQGLVLLDEEEAFSVRDPKFQQQSYIGSVADMLSGFRLFEGLNVEAIKSVIAYLRLDRFPDGHLILNRGDRKQKLFIILSGKAEMMTADSDPIMIIGKGDVFGETTCLSQQPEEYQLMAIDPVTVLYLTEQQFQEAAQQLPEFEKNFIRLLSERLTKIYIRLQEKRIYAMSGELMDLPVSRLFEKMHKDNATGTLILKTDTASAYFSFNQGIPVNARWLDKKGEDAFINAFVLKSGSYMFLSELTSEDAAAAPIGEFPQLMTKGLAKVKKEDTDFLKTKMPGF